MRNSQHWYDRDGKPCHGADLRTARKAGLLPSVTTVLKCWPQDNLTRWKNEQLVIAAITTPRIPNEPDDAFISRILGFADEEARNAADVGTRRHDLIEDYNKGINLREVPGDDIPFIKPYMDWFDTSVAGIVFAEEIVTNPALGYAGKLDLLATMKDGSVAVVDVKNRKNPKCYDTDAAQLAAYGEVVNADKCISVILGTQEPSILVREWEPMERREAWQNFTLCLELWKRSKNYWPERTQEPAVA
jgi:hypothetical protein